jgi:hypothetical protein
MSRLFDYVKKLYSPSIYGHIAQTADNLTGSGGQPLFPTNYQLKQERGNWFVDQGSNIALIAGFDCMLLINFIIFSESIGDGWGYIEIDGTPNIDVSELPSLKNPVVHSYLIYVKRNNVIVPYVYHAAGSVNYKGDAAEDETQMTWAVVSR